MAMLTKNFGRLMKNDKFKKKLSERLKKALRESEPKEVEKKDPRGPRCFECLGLYRLTVRILSREKGMPTMRLLVMSQKKKKILLKINF
jgi:hypothetical protein